MENSTRKSSRKENKSKEGDARLSFGGGFIRKKRVLSVVTILMLLFTNPVLSQAKSYKAPWNNGFKSYEDAHCITNSRKLPQGKLKRKYVLSKYGVYTVNGRYCIAVGSYYSKKVGTKMDLVLRDNGKNRVLKCILADCKADQDTNKTHQVHKGDGSIVEFVVQTGALPRRAAYITGDVSDAGRPFRGRIIKIKVYR